MFTDVSEGPVSYNFYSEPRRSTDTYISDLKCVTAQLKDIPTLFLDLLVVLYAEKNASFRNWNSLGQSLRIIKNLRAWFAFVLPQRCLTLH